VAREWYGNGAPTPLTGRLEFIQDTELSATHTLVELQAGLEKNPAQWFFLFFWGVFRAFYIFTQKREFLGFSQFQEYFKVHPDVKL
jgi:hypothetical protein